MTKDDFMNIENVDIYAEPDSPDKRGGETVKWNEAKKQELLDSFKSVSSVVAEMMDDTPPQSEFSMSKIEVKLAVSASGKVGFLGTGAEASADASITVVFERNGTA